MALYYDDKPHRPERAQQIWLILIGKAANKQLMTYKELAEILGYKGSGVFADTLDHIACYCIQNNLPGLTCLVVNEETGVPGGGIPVADPEAERMKVFSNQWYKLFPPSPSELKEAYDTCKR